jgi:transcriptional regulator with XRE-family HTH domain
MPSPGGSPRARALGAELRGFRSKKKIGLRELARKLEVSHGQLVRYEAGDRVPRIEDLATILAVLGVKEPERSSALDLARDADGPNWLPGVRELLTALIEFERTAKQITEVSPLLIPGLLQTADYARAIMREGSSGSELETKVTLRMGRRDALLRPKPVVMHALIGEWALRERLGGSEVMRDQLWYLVDMAKRKNITIQVLPANLGRYTPILIGQFMLLEFPIAAPIVHLEHYRSSAFLYDEDDVAQYVNASTNLSQVALSPAASVELISRLAEEKDS